MPTEAELRIVVAARRCFAAKGYAGTTIAEIEEAAGYRPRTGGVYRHFASKRAMLDAVIASELAANAEAITDQPDPAPGVGLRQVLERVVRLGLAQLDRQAELMRIVFRDLDQFPDLMAQVRDGLTDATRRDLAGRLAKAESLGLVPHGDHEAFAVICVGAVFDYGAKEHLLGLVSLDVDRDRFAATWVDVMATYLERSPT